MASRMNAWRLRSRSRSSGGGPSSAAAAGQALVLGAGEPGPGSPTSSDRVVVARGTPARRGVATSSSSPTIPISGVGAIADPGASL